MVSSLIGVMAICLRKSPPSVVMDTIITCSLVGEGFCHGPLHANKAVAVKRRSSSQNCVIPLVAAKRSLMKLLLYNIIQSIANHRPEMLLL
jgi:hypothetical protein